MIVISMREEDKRTITRRMDDVLNGLENEFRTLCDIRDFENALEALRQAGATSDRSSKLKKLYNLFDLCGIAYERGQEIEYYEKLVKESEIPTFEGVQDRMLFALYKRYKEYPAPEDFMKRIVDRLSHQEDGWQNDTLRLRILKQFIKYGNYLADAKYGGRSYVIGYVQEKLGRAPTEEEVLEAVDDDVFAVLPTATRAQRKPEGTYGLLKTVDDLATGKFRAEGATKRSLYLFAMVYGMSYFTGSEQEIVDYRTDIETNLFRDYYTNNLMRFVTEAYQRNMAQFELDPSGQGINYKNFAEMIYLYYIARDGEAWDKIKASSKMIREVQEAQFKKGAPQLARKGRTVYYQRLFAEDILRMPEKEFQQWICEHYDCDTYVETYEGPHGPVDRKASPFQLETKQETAYAVYTKILKKIVNQGVALEDCNYGLWLTDIDVFRTSGYEDMRRRHKDEIVQSSFEEFLNLLQGFNSFIKEKALRVSSPSDITRTSLIVAYYYYYNAAHEMEAPEKWKNFERLFKNFEKDVNPLLEAAHYQTLSGKNIFDVMIVFSSYARLFV